MTVRHSFESIGHPVPDDAKITFDATCWGWNWLTESEYAFFDCEADDWSDTGSSDSDYAPSQGEPDLSELPIIYCMGALPEKMRGIESNGS